MNSVLGDLSETRRLTDDPQSLDQMGSPIVGKENIKGQTMDRHDEQQQLKMDSQSTDEGSETLFVAMTQMMKMMGLDTTAIRTNITLMTRNLILATSRPSTHRALQHPTVYTWLHQSFMKRKDTLKSGTLSWS